jgi:hypothetical protein
MLAEQKYKFQSVAINANENEKFFQLIQKGTEIEKSVSPTNPCGHSNKI